jgi:hypothetical protein
VPQDIPITPDGARLEPGATHIPNHGRIFTPFWTEGTIMLCDIAGYIATTLAAGKK